jgi:hypothetical protein
MEPAREYQFVLANECDSQVLEEPGTLKISISGIRIGKDNQVGFVNDCCESADPPFFW